MQHEMKEIDQPEAFATFYTGFYEDENGLPCYGIEVDYSHPRLVDFPESLVRAVVQCICEFVLYTREDRSYDAQSILGSLWDRSHPVHLGRIVSALASLPTTPLKADPDSPKQRKRYRVFL